MRRLLTSSKGQMAMASILAVLLLWFGVPNAEEHADKIATAAMALITLIASAYQITTAWEDVAKKSNEPSNGGGAEPTSPPTSGPTPLRCLLPFMLMLPLGAAMIGCDPMADRTVERHSYDLAADLKYRGVATRKTIDAEMDAFESKWLTAIDQAETDALRVLEGRELLTAEVAKRSAERFAGLRYELKLRVAAARTLAIQGTEWFDLAAGTVLATTEYYQRKDAALVEAAKAGLESFGATYAATRREPATEGEAKAQGLIEQIQTELTTILKARLPQ